MPEPSLIRRTVALVGAAAASCTLLGLPASATAQQDPEIANVLGRVLLAESQAPLVDAYADFPDLEISRATDETGRFWFKGVPAGEHLFVVRYLGYVDSTTVSLIAGQLNQLDITVALRIVPVPELLVQIEALQAPHKLGEFDRRRSRAAGYFITREDIIERNPNRTSDMLRRVPGVRLSMGSRGGVLVRVRGRSCPVAYFVDGVRAPNYNVDNVHPMSVAGIEIYRGPSTVPPEFRGPLTGTCAVIAIWTRDPSAP